MPEQDFLTELTETIAQRKIWYENTELPRLNKCFTDEEQAISQLMEWTIRRGYIAEDPYNNEKKVDALGAISDMAINPAKFAEDLGIRIADLHRMIKYISEVVDFRLDALTPSVIQKIKVINGAFLWEELGNTLTNANTKAFSALVNIVRQKGDNLTLSLIHNSTETLANLVMQENMILAGILDFHKENYKCVVRKALSRVSGYTEAADSVSAGYESVKAIFQTQVVKLPFNNAAILEIVEENVSADKDLRRDALIKKLKVLEKKKAKVEDVPPRDYLLSALDVMAGFSSQIDSIANKISVNSGILKGQSKTLFSNFVRFLKQVLGFKEPPAEYKLQVKSDNDETYSRTETVVLDELQDYLHTKSRFYKDLENKESDSYQSLLSFSDAQLDEFIGTTMTDTRHHLKILMALDAYFKDTAVGENKHKIRGFKIENTTLVSMIFKVEKCRVDYAGVAK